MKQRSLTLLGSLVALAAASTAQQSSIAQQEGDIVFGTGGSIVRINKLAVTDSGILFTNCDLDGTSSSADDVILLNGFLSLPESATLALPVGAKIDKFLDMDINEKGFLGWPLEISGGGITNSNDTGVYWNTLLLAQENGPITATEYRGEPLPLGGPRTYNRFNVVKISNRDSVLFAGRMSIVSGTQAAISLIETDGIGGVTGERILFLQGYPFPGTEEEVNSVGTSVNSIALANDDSTLTQVKIGSDNSMDSVIALNDTILAREGTPAPVPLDPESGEVRTYTDLGGTKLDLNDFGEYVYVGFANGDTNTNLFLVVNGETYIQEGENIPAFGNATLDRFDSVGMMIANSGDLYWYAKTDESASSDQYLLRNGEVIVQENTTVIDGESITRIRSVQYGFHVSDSGRFWVAEGENGSGDEVILFVDFGTSYPLNGCGSNPATLVKTSGEARVGDTLELEMDGEQAVGAIPLLFLSLGSALPGNLRDTQQCGIQRPLGEIMISLSAANLVERIPSVATDGSPVNFTLNIPNDAALVGLQVYSQGVYWDVAGTSGTVFQPSNGFYMEFGAP